MCLEWHLQQKKYFALVKSEGAKNFVKCREFMNIALTYEINIIKNFVMKNVTTLYFF